MQFRQEPFNLKVDYDPTVSTAQTLTDLKNDISTKFKALSDEKTPDKIENEVVNVVNQAIENGFGLTLDYKENTVNLIESLQAFTLTLTISNQKEAIRPLFIEHKFDTKNRIIFTQMAVL